MNYNYSELKDKYISFLKSNGYKETDVAIHCSSQERASILVHIFSIMGKMWSPTAPLLLASENNRPNTRWKKDGPKTCYRVNEKSPEYIAKSSIAFYQQRGNVEIVSFDDIFPGLCEDNEVEEPIKQKTGFSMGSLFSGKKNKRSDEKDDAVFGKNDVVNENSVVEANEINEALNDDNTTNSSDIENVDEKLDDSVELSEAQIEDDIKDDEVKAVNDVFDNVTESRVSSNVNNDVFKDFLPNDNDYLPLSFPVLMTPFTVDSFGERIFRINKQCIREELNFGMWLHCNKEWEFSFILSHPSEIKYISL